MKFIAAGAFALLLALQLTGCSRTVSTTTPAPGISSLNSSRPVDRGVKPVSQVSPCCRELAAGRISLDQCMQNPVCVAKNRVCCMNAIK